MFFENREFFKINWLDCEQYGKNHYKKKEHNQHSSVLKLSYNLPVKDSLIIPLTFILLSCCEKAYHSKKFGCENSKPCCESQITTR